MEKTQPEFKTKRRRVTFSFELTDANAVILAGDFNQWNLTTHPMKKDGNGSWKKSLLLPPGKYEYKFLADGQWVIDPQNKQSTMNCFGTLNSVIDLAQK